VWCAIRRYGMGSMPSAGVNFFFSRKSSRRCGLYGPRRCSAAIRVPSFAGNGATLLEQELRGQARAAGWAAAPAVATASASIRYGAQDLTMRCFWDCFGARICLRAAASERRVGSFRRKRRHISARRRGAPRRRGCARGLPSRRSRSDEQWAERDAGGRASLPPRPPRPARERRSGATVRARGRRRRRRLRQRRRRRRQRRPRAAGRVRLVCARRGGGDGGELRRGRGCGRRTRRVVSACPANTAVVAGAAFSRRKSLASALPSSARRAAEPSERGRCGRRHARLREPPRRPLLVEPRRRQRQG